MLEKEFSSYFWTVGIRCVQFTAVWKYFFRSTIACVLLVHKSGSTSSPTHERDICGRHWLNLNAIKNNPPNLSPIIKWFWCPNFHIYSVSGSYHCRTVTTAFGPAPVHHLRGACCHRWGVAWPPPRAQGPHPSQMNVDCKIKPLWLFLHAIIFFSQSYILSRKTFCSKAHFVGDHMIFTVGSSATINQFFEKNGRIFWRTRGCGCSLLGSKSKTTNSTEYIRISQSLLELKSRAQFHLIIASVCSAITQSGDWICIFPHIFFQNTTLPLSLVWSPSCVIFRPECPGNICWLFNFCRWHHTGPCPM